MDIAPGRVRENHVSCVFRFGLVVVIFFLLASAVSASWYDDVWEKTTELLQDVFGVYGDEGSYGFVGGAVSGSGVDEGATGLDVSSCDEYCVSLAYSDGTCRQNPAQCTNNGEVNEAGGNIYCTGGPSADTCCCEPTPSSSSTTSTSTSTSSTSSSITSTSSTSTSTSSTSSSITSTSSTSSSTSSSITTSSSSTSSSTDTTTTTISLTCGEYCISLAYSDGVCRQNPVQCTNNGEVNEAGGTIYCTGGPSADTCCCLPTTTTSTTTSSTTTIMDNVPPNVVVTHIVSTSDRTPDLNASTSENAICYYCNQTSAYLVMDNTGGTFHWHTLSELSLGDYIYHILCKDSMGNSGRRSIPFAVVSEPSENSFFNDSLNLPADETIQVNASSNVLLDLKVGANLSNATIVLAEYPTDPQGIQTGFAVLDLGRYITLNADEDIENNLAWMMVYVHYTDAEVAVRGIVESTLRMYYFNNSIKEWVLVRESGVNVNKNYVWGNLTHFSIYGIGGRILDYVKGVRDSKPKLAVDSPEYLVVGEQYPITIRLHNEKGAGAVVYNADVAVRLDERLVYSGETGPSGTVIFTPMETGEYRVTASKEGYVPVGYTITVVESTVTAPTTTTTMKTTTTTIKGFTSIPEAAETASMPTTTGKPVTSTTTTPSTTTRPQESVGVVAGSGSMLLYAGLLVVVAVIILLYLKKS